MQYDKIDSRIYWQEHITVSRAIKKLKREDKKVRRTSYLRGRLDAILQLEIK